jgi:hypothetical protein
MSTPPTLAIPPSAEIVARVYALRAELRALRQLLRLARAAEKAEAARQHGQAIGRGGPRHAK